MKNLLRFTALAVVPLLVLVAAPAAQKIETVDGVRVVHNGKGGLWGKAPKVALELVRKIGDVDTEDEHVAFNYPSATSPSTRTATSTSSTPATPASRSSAPTGSTWPRSAARARGPANSSCRTASTSTATAISSSATRPKSRLHVIIGGGKDSKPSSSRTNGSTALRCLAGGGYVGRASTWVYPMRGQPAPKVAEMRLFRQLRRTGGSRARSAC